MIRTAIIYCPNSVHDEGDKERNVPCEEFHSAEDGGIEYHVADYSCPKCGCTEEEYLPEQGRPWVKARERIIPAITTRALDLVYGDNENRKRESAARIERLRTIGHGEDRARELSFQLQQELSGGNNSFRDKAERIAEKLRQDFEGLDIARMRDEAQRHAQESRKRLEATDEGSIDMWEHMDVCLSKESDTRVAKAKKRLKVFPDERDRFDKEEEDKPEQYRVPKVELIFDWDHSQQGRPPLKKHRGAKWTALPTDTNTPHVLSKLSTHMNVDLPQARQAYETRKSWKESRKRNREEFEQDEGDNDGAGAQTSAPAQQPDVGPAAKRRPRTSHGRRSGGRSSGVGSASAISPEHALMSTEQDPGLAHLSSPTSSAGRQGTVAAALPPFVPHQQSATSVSPNSSWQTGVFDPYSSINLFDFPSIDSRLASSPNRYIPSTSAQATGSTYGGWLELPGPAYPQSHPTWHSPANDRDIAASARFAPFGELSTVQGVQQQPDLTSLMPALANPEAHNIERGYGLLSPSQAQYGQAWPTPQQQQPTYQQHQLSPSTSQRFHPPQSNLPATSEYTSPTQQLHHSFPGPAYSSRVQQPASAVYGYQHQGPGNAANLDPTTGYASSARPTTHTNPSMNPGPASSLYIDPADAFGTAQASGGGFALEPIHEHTASEFPTSYVRNTASYDDDDDDDDDDNDNTGRTGIPYPPNMSLSQNIPGMSSPIVSPVAQQQQEQQHHHGTYYSGIGSAVDPRIPSAPNTSANSYYSPTQPAGQASDDYLATNDFSTLVNQHLSQQAADPAQHGEGPCTDSNCETCRQLYSDR